MPQAVSIRVEYIGPKPGQFFDEREFNRVVDDALMENAQAIRVDYRVTVRTWSNKPVFKLKRGGKSSEKWIDIYTEDEIYGYVSGGTKGPYLIQPRPERLAETRGHARLVFEANYKAKTKVRSISSREGGSFGPVVAPPAVMHPGIEAREFPEVIGEKWDEEWPRNLQRAIAAATYIK